MALPLLFERISQDPSIKNYGDLAAQLSFTEVEPDMVINRVNELTELKSLIDLALSEYMVKAKVRMEEGYEIQGFTLAAGRKTRKVADETRLAARLLDAGLNGTHLYQKKLVGLPAIEKLLKAQGKSNDEIVHIFDDVVTTTVGDASAKIA